MNLEQLQKTLLAAARTTPPDDRVPYAFEKRILARLAAQPAVRDEAALWARALWRAALPCVGLTVLVAILSLTLVSSETASAGDDNISQQFEHALLVSVEQLEDVQ
jgi:hypothetical protein